MKRKVENYNLIARLVHWFSAVVIIGMFIVGLWMVDLSYYSEWYQRAPHWHKSVGLLLAFLTLFRLGWKVFTPSPDIIGSNRERLAATTAHISMYLILLTIFISGYLISTEDGRSIDIFTWFELPGMGALFENQADIAGEIHFYLAWTLMVLVVVHLAAALKHHFLDRDDTLRKMLGVSK
jgi:cytochrome b561